ncbi:uncharacterized protein [Asterias amurensis]|uniref:uncharacterized protein n=1 Tax=Asterias amurensis TaxID=7602 RepID=UPI003AB2F48C
MEGFIDNRDQVRQIGTRNVLRELRVADTSDSQSNIQDNEEWDAGILRRRTLRPRPRVTYEDLSPIHRRTPSPLTATGSFTFEPNIPEERGDIDQEQQEANQTNRSLPSEMNFETPPKTPRSSRKSPSKRPIEMSPSTTDLPFTIHIDSPGDSPAVISLLPKEPVPAKRPRMLMLGDQASLGQQLASLTNEQLVELVEGVVEKYPEMHKEVLALLPEPDLTQYQERLSQLLHNIFRALPRTRLASTRGALSYRQVKVHLLEFKKYCIQQGRHLLSCQAWGAVINYVLLAWQLVNFLPIWENPAHNKVRSQCLRSLVLACSKALRSDEIDTERLTELRPRLLKACRLNSMMQPCLDSLRISLDSDV